MKERGARRSGEALTVLALGLLWTAGGCSRCQDPGQPDAMASAPAPEAPAATPKQRSSFAALQSLPYLNWVPVPDQDKGRRGVVRQDPERVSPGLNFFSSRPRSRAHLMDLQGRIVHTWSSDFGQPTAVDLEWTKVSPQMDLQGWHHVELVDNGDLLAIVPLHMLLRLDRRSRLRWVIQLPVHHDIAVDPAGQIVTLGVIKRTIQHQGEQMMILDNSIITLSAQGKILGQLSLFDALRASSRTSSLLQAKLDWSLGFFRSNFLLYYMWALMVMPLPDVGQIHALYTSIFDGSFKGSRRAELMFLVPLIPVNILHVNSVEILERGVGGLWRQGDLLICLREMNQVLVLERASGRVRWAWGADQLDHPHHPSLTREGHLLIFDNGMDRQRSRVIELDPRTRRIVWTYAGSRSEPFYSRIRGASQKLTNGNVLITDSERGRVIEVTRQGEIVWEFFNPDADNPWESGKRAPIYRMMRVPPPAFLEAERSRSR